MCGGQSARPSAGSHSRKQRRRQWRRSITICCVLGVVRPLTHRDPLLCPSTPLFQGARTRETSSRTFVEVPHSTVPSSASCRPAIRLNSVDFPDPFGPTLTNGNSPRKVNQNKQGKNTVESNDGYDEPTFNCFRIQNVPARRQRGLRAPTIHC